MILFNTYGEQGLIILYGKKSVAPARDGCWSFQFRRNCKVPNIAVTDKPHEVFECTKRSEIGIAHG